MIGNKLMGLIRLTDIINRIDRIMRIDIIILLVRMLANLY